MERISNRGDSSSERATKPKTLKCDIAISQCAACALYVDFFNKGWLDYFGLPVEELYGWGWTKTFHPDDVEACVGKWRAALASGESFEGEGRVRRADGEYRTLLHQKVPMRDKLGQIVKWYGSSFDIEDRKRADNALRRSEAILVQTQRLTRVGSWVYRPPDIAEYWSPMEFEIFGLDPQQGPPRNLEAFLPLVHPDDRQRLRDGTEAILSSSNVFEYKYRIIRPDGSIRISLSLAWLRPIL